MLYALIMAGGSGTRLWPLSRKKHPKQALKLVGERTMFQQAVERLDLLLAPENIWVVTRDEHVSILQEQCPQVPMQNYVVEPEGRGTAPAIGLAAIHLQKKDPQAVMAVLTADHYISKKEEFNQALQSARKLAEAGHLVTLGITPSSPSTGFGYIQQDKSIQPVDGFTAYQVECFTEKPNLETAVQMVASGQYSWNSGMFVWRVDRILEEFARQMPGLYAYLQVIKSVLGTPGYDALMKCLWPQVEKQSIDYGIMEKAKDVVVIPVDIGWTDVGSWGSLLELLPKDANENIFIGPVLGMDSKSTMVFSKNRLIAMIGIENLIVVDTDDAILICSKENEQDVKAMTERINQSKFNGLL